MLTDFQIPYSLNLEAKRLDIKLYTFFGSYFEKKKKKEIVHLLSSTGNNMNKARKTLSID